MISELLSIGVKNSVSGRELCRELHIDPRQLTRQVMIERRQGIPICASCNSLHPGYYLAEDKEALDKYCRILYRRLGEIAKTYRALKQCSVPEGDE